MEHVIDGSEFDPRGYTPHFSGNQPHGMPNQKHKQQDYRQPHPQQTKQPSQPQGKSQSIVYHLWRLGDVQMIDDLADKWVRGIQPGMTWMYLAVYAAMACVVGYIAWHMDISPSYAFAVYMGGTGVLIFVGSLVPTLLEFFGAGFALAGNKGIEIALKLFIVFDAVTDTPNAYAISQKVVAYFSQLGSVAIDPQIIEAVEIVLTAPMLFVATFVVESIFLSFVIASFRLLKKSFGWGR